VSAARRLPVNAPVLALCAIALVVVIVAVFVGWPGTPVDPPGTVITERPLIAPNGLPDDQRDAFYHLPEGGNFIPYNVFRALEQPDSRALFRDNLERYGFLPDIRNAANPHALPVGMTIEEAPDLRIPIVGVNCTACHVGEIQYNSIRYRIEGAPNLVDYTTFNMDFAQSMTATIKDPEKLFRFLVRYYRDREAGRDLFSRIESYAALLEAGASLEADFFHTIGRRLQDELEAYESLNHLDAHTRAREILLDPDRSARLTPETLTESSFPESIDDAPLRDGFFAPLAGEHAETTALESLHEVLTDVRLVLARINLLRTALKHAEAPMTPPGPGRFDAFNIVRNLSFGEYAVSPMTAPTSISPLWGIGDHAYYHFLGMTTTVVGRNIAAIDFIVTKDFENTLLIDNINRLESMFRELKSPEWPEFLPPIDAGRAERGRAIFQGEGERYRDTRRGNCASCHARAEPWERDPSLLVYPRFTPEELGVDANLMHAFNAPLSPELTLADAIAEQTGGIEARFREDRGLSMEEWIATYEYGRNYLVWNDSPTHPARTLEGVWATAPYLHNNSVPTLYDLLRPADDRPTTFAVGHRDYDPVRVGYTADPAQVAWVFDVNEPVRDLSGNSHPSLPNGNSNAGHEFGVDLSDDERFDLIEYLKTL
jgi:hypothetical protein